MKYDQLYIYLIEGIVRDEEVDFGPFFIGNWIEENWSFLFFSRPSKEEVVAFLEQRKDLSIIDEFFFTYEQWQGGNLRPFQVGGFEIVPAWEASACDESKKRILIDPGVVFGSGLHPTTRDSLILLQYLYKESRPKRVLDLGTGTGILAIASACLGADKIVAIDLNPLCVRTAKENIRINGLMGRIQVMHGSAEDFVGEPVDLVLANIHYGVMEKLFEKQDFAKRPWYILSGLMRSEWRHMKRILDQAGIRVVKELDHEMTWFTLLATTRK